MIAVDMHDLSAVRGDFVLGPVSCEVQAGEVLALCGANGSGKTTLLNLLLGTLTPIQGQLRLFGEVVEPQRRDYMRRVGFVPDETTTLFGELTAMEHVRLMVARRDSRQDRALVSRRGEELLERLDLAADRTLARNYSHGMSKKLQLTLAMMHEPALLIVDELRNGLDPLSAREAEELVREAVERGTAVVAATHDLFWIERMNPLVLLLRRGEVRAHGLASTLVEPGQTLEDSFMGHHR